MDSDNEDNNDMYSCLQESINLNDVSSKNGAKFCVTNVYEDEAEESYDSIIPFEALIRNNTQNEDILGLSFDDIAGRFTSLTDDSGVKKLLITEGEGAVVNVDSEVSVHYNAFLEYADEPFDSTRCRKKPLKFKLGHMVTIEGFEIAIKSMKKKEVSCFLISPDYAYGDIGCPPRIPSAASFLYFVELLDFESEQDDFYKLPPFERIRAPIEVMIKTATKLHKKGKLLYNEKKFYQAVRSYQKELDILEGHNYKDEDEENKIKPRLMNVYENLSLCHLKLSNSTQCIAFANKAMYLKGDTFKLLFFKGKALRQLGQFSHSKKILNKALTLLPEDDPNKKSINVEINKLEKNWKILLELQTDAYKDIKFTDENFENSSFDNLFSDSIKLFKDDKDLIVLPFTCKLYTNDQLEIMRNTAKKNNLICQEFTNEGENEMHILKMNTVLQNQQL